MKEIRGMQYHEGTKAWHLRVGDVSVLTELVTLLRSNANSQELPFINCHSLHLSMEESFLSPVQPVAGHEQMLKLFLDALCKSCHELKEVQIGRALMGFAPTNQTLGAWFSVEALQRLVASLPQLEILMLRNLELYSSTRVELHDDNRNENENASATPANTIQKLTHCLHGHKFLQRFGWQHCQIQELPTFTMEDPSLDPLFQALATIPTLQEFMVQTPPWVPAVPTHSTEIWKQLIGKHLKGLHLDGVHLENQHLQQLFLSNKEHCYGLTDVSLSLQLSLDSCQDIAQTLGAMLQMEHIPLQQLCLKLAWQETTPLAQDGLVSRYHQRQQRLAALQSFQDTLAWSLKQAPHSQLQRLDLIYYDAQFYHCNNSSNTVNSNNNNKMTSQYANATRPDAFRQLLQHHNYTLTHLRLPYCGEMDTGIDFFLKLNRTGLRQRLLACRSEPSPQLCVGALFELVATAQQQQQRQQTSNQQHPFKECWGMVKPNNTTTTSMMYYMLQEMPVLFIA